MDIQYKDLRVDDVKPILFGFFDRTQIVTKCWRKIDGKWGIKDIAFVDNWSDEDYRQGVIYLKDLIISGGYAVGAFVEDKLKGFVSVEPATFGKTARYLNLSNIHVSRDMRGKGIGRELFHMAREWARNNNADKLYISAHSSIESQAFYKAMGCVEATEYNRELAEKEPCDCQLEYVL